MKKLKSYVKKYVIPAKIWTLMHKSRCNIRYYKDNILPLHIVYNQREHLIKKSTNPINVLFFAVIDNNWKYDSLFKLMMENPNFNPLIIVCPCPVHDKEFLDETMKQCCQYFDAKKYPYICSYDPTTKSYIDARGYKPDIIFYTTPYPGGTIENYTMNNFKDVLSCYVDYFYVTFTEPWTCASDFHKMVWRYYLEYSLLEKQINQLYWPCKVNTRVVGYPHFDAFRQYRISDNDWPISGARKKRIIWSPHHTISSNSELIAMSTFEKYYDFMWRMAEKYSKEIQIVFKPHPALKPRLYKDDNWGKERTDAYYERWANGINTAYVNGEYVGLFLASDAMIHDCNSFTVEYLAVNKPVMFLDSGKMDEKLNEVGVEARNCHYKGYSQEDIERFIQDVILSGDDELKERREAFFKNYILPSNGKLAAENIIDDLLLSLGRK